MPPEDKFDPGGSQAEATIEIEGLLSQIEGEQVPERLLTLAQELQHVLSLRRKQLSLNQH